MARRRSRATIVAISDYETLPGFIRSWTAEMIFYRASPTRDKLRDVLASCGVHINTVGLTNMIYLARVVVTEDGALRILPSRDAITKLVNGFKDVISR